MRRTVATAVVVSLTLLSAGTALAHPGGTDSSGGHYCRTNCADWGLAPNEYHYHNGGGSSGSSGGGGSTGGTSGSSSGGSSTPVVTDTTAPERPTIHAVDVDGSTVAVRVSGEDGTRITIASDGATVATDSVDGTTELVFDLPDGEHELSVSLTDAAGNTSAARTRSVTVDTVPPTVPDLEVEIGTEDAPTSVVGFRASEQVDWVLHARDIRGQEVRRGRAVAGERVSIDLLLPPGPQVFRLAVTDSAGNEVEEPTNLDVTVPAPTSAPTLEVGGTPSDARRELTVKGPAFGLATLTLHDGGGTELELDEDGRASYELPTMDDGQHELKVTAVDFAGREAPMADAVLITVDRTAPRIRFEDGEDGMPVIDVDDPDAELVLTAEALDGPIIVAAGALGDLDLPFGDHTLHLVATDAFGNEAAADYELTLTDPFAAFLSGLFLIALFIGSGGGAWAFSRRRRRAALAAAPPPPGWYPAPERDGLDRYWDGSTWTEDRRKGSEGVQG